LRLEIAVEDITTPITSSKNISRNHKYNLNACKHSPIPALHKKSNPHTRWIVCTKSKEIVELGLNIFSKEQGSIN
jgi:hypothetical protein